MIESNISPSTIFSSGNAEKILEIKKEIAQINLHRAEHITAGGQKVLQIDQSCRYCLVYLESKVRAELAPSVQEEIVATSDAAPKHEVSNNGSRAVKEENNLERIVDLDGKKGRITVPRSWASRKVRVTLLHDYTT
jgi:hypothetical protein